MPLGLLKTERCLSTSVPVDPKINTFEATKTLPSEISKGLTPHVRILSSRGLCLTICRIYPEEEGKLRYNCRGCMTCKKLRDFLAEMDPQLLKSLEPPCLLVQHSLDLSGMNRGWPDVKKPKFTHKLRSIEGVVIPKGPLLVKPLF
jgi:hypothetical protein